jgi:hypothetical protein
VEREISVAELAARSIEDPDYAQKVLFGEIDNQEVRDAILADLYESTTITHDRTEEEAFALFNENFRDLRPIAGPMGPCFVKYYPKGPKPEMWEEWVEMEKPYLQRLAQRESS